MSSTDGPHDVKSSFLTELCIVFRCEDVICCRLEHWTEHVNTFAKIKCPTRDPTQSRTTRIDFAAHHLDIIDRKFGILLQFQALLAAVVGLAVKAFWPDQLVHFTTCQIWLVLVPLLLGFLVWIANTVLCLSGVRRVTWGDLWRDKDDPLKAETNHLNKLLREVIKRTAKFRVAVRVTTIGVIMLPLLVVGFAADRMWCKQDPIPCPLACVAPLAKDHYKLTSSQVYFKGHLSHIHTFLVNQNTGDLWQMICQKGNVVEFRQVMKTSFHGQLQVPPGRDELRCEGENHTPICMSLGLIKEKN